MDQFTYELLAKKYKKLNANHSDLMEFDSLESFIEEFEGQRATPEDGTDWRVTRCDDSLGVEPGNLRLVSIEHDADLAKYSYPTV